VGDKKTNAKPYIKSKTPKNGTLWRDLPKLTSQLIRRLVLQYPASKIFTLRKEDSSRSILQKNICLTGDGELGNSELYSILMFE
jgi:hypothetical protein